ncbi:MAG: right-handed parallel beta-helix repeat-containing protein [Candidatus Binatia bacterium]
MKPVFLLLISCLASVLTLPPGTAAAGSVYYVATNGSDQDPGSVQQPFRTIAYAATRAHAGDLVVVNPGQYKESVALTRAGTQGAPIVLRGLPGAVLTSPNPAKSLSAFDIGAHAAFVTVQNFELAGGFDETVFVRPGAHDIELSGLRIHNNHTGIWIAGASNVVVHDCIIDHNFRTGIRIYAGAHHVHVADTRSEANDDGLGCNGASDGFNADSSTSDIVFERVSAIGNSQDGFDFKCPNVTLLQAISRDNGCSGVKLWAGAYVENVLVEGNNTGINAPASAGTTTVLQNCTMSQNALGVRVLGSGNTLMMRNCIVTGPAKALSYDSTVQLIEHHNIFYRPLSKDRLIVREDPSGETLYSGDEVNSGQWQRESGQGQQTVAVDPRLDPASSELLINSPAIDSGDPSGAPPVDLVGRARPLGNGFDRGAFERPPGGAVMRSRSTTVRGYPAGFDRTRLR